MTEDPTTEELRIVQADREAKDRESAERASADETEQHERRAEKAAYLREKLEERATAEREAGGESSRSGDHGEEMERRSEDLAEDIEDTKADWESKKADDAVPGAAPDEMTEESDASP